MESLIESPATPNEFPQQRILLLDCNSETRDARSKALQDRGALVDSADSAACARAMWTPGSHELLLIDLHGAGAEVHDFCRFVQDASARQKVGFYMARPPYVTLSRARYESARPSKPKAVVVAPAVAERKNTSRSRVGVREAAMRIAALRRIAGVGRPSSPETSDRPASYAPPRPRVSFSEAIKLAERACEAAPAAGEEQ